MKKPADIFKLIEENDIRFIDFRFSDLKGRWHHITMTVRMLKEETFTEGLGFDGSSVEGWCDINKSDMFYRPDANSAFIDPFATHPTLVLACDIIDAETGEVYNRCPRGIAARAEQHLKTTGIADKAIFGPELEFFVFDNVTYGTSMGESFYSIDAAHASWSTGEVSEQGNTGHVAPAKGGYFKLAPVDRFQDMRSEMVETLTNAGIDMILHHPEVSTAGQCEMGMEANTPVTMGDHVHMYKYVVQNVADIYEHTATFMPKPICGDNGNGMHVHQSLWQNDKPLFAGNKYAGMSQESLWYIGGIIKHSKALNAFTNPLTNSYKRLIPGFEAPVILAYAARNRSAAIRIPASHSANSKRIEVRYPDCGANSYMAFSAMLMAGLDGIKNKIDPGEAMENNLYDLNEQELSKLPQVCGSLREALESLSKDRKFLTEGNVFSDDMINAYIKMRMEDVIKLEHTPAPIEFEMYYSI